MRKSSQRESAILTMSDLHFGKVTASFNPDVFAARLERLDGKLERIHQLLSGYRIEELVLALLGDVNDGTGVYPTQLHHQQITNVEEQADRLSELLADLAIRQRRVWGNVRIEAVPGNHGRAGKFAHEAANWDVVCYRYLSKILKPHGISVGMNDSGNPFIRKMIVRGHHYLLYHGHDIRTYSNIPWYGMMLRMARWLSTKLAPFDVVLMGHFHTLGDWEINRVKLLLSGTMTTDDEWSLQALGWEGTAKWWLFGVSDSRPVTWQFRIELDGE